MGFLLGLNLNAYSEERWEQIPNTNLQYDLLSIDTKCQIPGVGGYCSIWVKDGTGMKRHEFDCFYREKVGYWGNKKIRPGSKDEPIFFTLCGGQ